MKNLFLKILFSTVFFLVATVIASAAARYSVASTGNWNATSTWSATPGGASGASVPGSADDVTISSGTIVNVTAAASAATLIVDGTLNLTSGFDLTMTNAGSVTINSTAVLAFNTTGQIIGGNNNGNGIALTVNSGASLSTQNTIGFTTGSGNTTLTGSIAIKPGSFANTWNSGVNFTYNGTTAQATGNAVSSVNNLTISNSAGVTLSAATTVAGTLTLTSGTLTNTNTLTLADGSTIIRSAGTLSANPVYGTASSSRVDVTITGSVTSSFESTGTTGGIGTLTVSSGTYTLNAAKTIDNLTVSSGAILNAAAFVITLRTGGAVTIAGTFQTSDLNGFSGGASTAISSTNAPSISITSSTIEYSAASGTQTITPRTDYVNLTFSGAGAKSLASGTLTTSGDWSTSSGAATLGTATVTIGGNILGSGNITSTSGTLTVGGNFTNSGTFTHNSGTVTYNGTTQTLKVAVYNNLNLTGGAKTFGAIASIAGNLSLSTSATATTAAALAITGNLDIGSGCTFATGTTSTWTLGVTGTTNISGTLTLANTGAKSFTGNITINNGGTWNETGIAAFTIGANLQNDGTFTASTGLHTFTGGATKSLSGANTISIPNTTINGTYSNDGTLTVSTALAGSGTLVNSATGTLNLGGTFAITALTTSASGNTVNYTGTTQTLKVQTYHNLGLSGGAKTLGTISTINGNLSLTSTATATTGNTLSIGGNLDIASGCTLATGATNTWTLGVTGTTNVSGTLTLANTAAKSFTGNIIVNNGGTWNETGVAAFSIAGSLQNDGTFTANTGLHTFSGSTQTFSGANAISIASTTISGTYTNNGTLTVATALAGGGTLTNGATGTLNLGGTYAITTLATTTTGNSVNFTSGSAQTITATTYYNLGFSGAGTKTVALGTLTINGDWAVGSTTALNTNNPTVSVAGNITGSGNITSTSGTLTVSGNWTNNGTFTHNSGTVVFNNTTAQTVGNATYNNLTLKSAGLKTTTTVTVNGTFSLEGTATISNAITFGASSTLQYKTGSVTVTNNEFPTAFAGSVIVDIGSGNTLTLNGNKTSLAGNLTITSGTFDLSSFTANRASAGGTLTIAAGATLKIGGSSTTLPSNYSTHSISNTSTVEYAGTTQTVATLNSSQTYGNLTISGSGTKTLGGSVTVAGTLTLTGSTLTIGNSSRTLSLKGSVINSSGGLNAQSGTLEFNNGSDVTLPSALFVGSISNLSIKGGNKVTFGASQTINASLAITNNSKLAIGSGNTLTINGSTSLDANNTISSSSTSSLQIGGSSVPATGTLYFDQSANSLYDFTITKNALSDAFTLGNTLRILNTLTPTKGTLNTGGNLVIASSATATGRINKIVATDFAFVGNITQERYVGSKTTRRWLFVTPTVDNITVRNAWQDDIFITGTGTGGTPCGSTTGNGGTTDKYNSNGFDATTANVVSLFEYKQSDANRWVALPNTSTTLSKGKGYRILFRGERGASDSNCSKYLTTQTPPAPVSATLNITGAITTGSFTYPVDAKTTGTYGYTLLGNPYPCEMDFDLFYADVTNTSIISNKYWTYDPYSSSTNYLVYTYVQGIGPEVTGNSGGTITAANGGRIASGQAFFVESVNGGSVNFSEDFKTVQTQQGVFRNTNTVLGSKIRVTFKQADSTFIDDAVIRFYDDPAVTTAESRVYDAATLNSGSYIASIKGNRSFAIQTRPLNFLYDTVLVRIVSATTGNFLLNFSDYQNFTEAAEITLLDLYTGSVTDVKANPIYAFTITSNAATQGGRFKLVFRSMTSVLPLSFINISANQKDKNVLVQWKVAFEQNVTNYVVERSENGKDFTSIGTVASKGNSSTAVDYAYLDTKPLNAIAYYRIKSVEAGGDTKYSAIVKVNSSKSTSISLYPNPAKDKVTIMVTNADNYSKATITVRNIQGKTMLQQVANLSIGNYSMDISNLSPSVYFITITGNSGESTMEKLIKY